MNEHARVGLDPIEDAIAAIAEGRAVIVVDDEDRENEGDLIFAAEKATPELLAFMVRYTSGYICATLPGAELDRLAIPPQYHVNEDSRGTAYAVAVDAADRESTGISARDRAHTLNLLADPASTPASFTRPGHVVPLRAVDGGVLRRTGHTEATNDLVRLAGLREAGVLCELVNDDGTMMRLPDLRAFAAEHGLPLVSIADLVEYRRRTERTVERVADTRLPTEHGLFRAVGYSASDGSEHVALVHGDLGDGEDVLVRVHSECLTGDAFGSLRCDCGPQFKAAMRAVAAEGRGVVLYMRGHEGRGIGLLQKLRAYELQDAGRDTVDANLDLGLPADARDYRIGAEILADLGLSSIRLLTNNPDKRAGIEGHGLTVLGRVALPAHAHPENIAYLRAKRDRMGHLFDELAVAAS
ncbi:riboflavin biosynthesis protein RibBA [Actinorhabdospora filicis]|uniref:Riboflavin biosynthesis protein RibBA n=1 Tax=Actinorhabdospora filicis TaxID=1785913 RepID=A0A9W6SGZ6_9ACTN|nr:bifunctional 3,4-dihydroxy-2-butanone-4-phosphate synthase/GTP cyclohydrolase II [Actinorhabdospora filicis]GLZ75241.1 riboflavin biosynthesis protein RibBA [Actinorhabdospora filicis]